MKLFVRRTCADDLNDIYDLHVKCFSQTDLWYKNNIKNYLDKGIVIVTDKKIIIGILLQGDIIPCNNNDNNDNDNQLFYKIEDNNKLINEYKELFNPINDNGIIFCNNNTQYKILNGIVMICVHPNYRKKGIAQKLINKYFNDNINKLICLHTRASNINAINLYIKMGYEHIGFIKNKYFLPTEDSAFMIKYL
jgi:ribosomal protein S18 acetylase RimI-like enzyme